MFDKMIVSVFRCADQAHKEGSGANFIKCMFLSGECFADFMRLGLPSKFPERWLLFPTITKKEKLAPPGSRITKKGNYHGKYCVILFLKRDISQIFNRVRQSLMCDYERYEEESRVG
jgi:hypothetical protein